MPRYLEIALRRRGVTCVAALLDDRAPRTCHAVWEALPQEGDVYHAKYAGNEFYTLVPAFPAEPLAASCRPGATWATSTCRPGYACRRRPLTSTRSPPPATTFWRAGAVGDGSASGAWTAMKRLAACGPTTSGSRRQAAGMRFAQTCPRTSSWSLRPTRYRPAPVPYGIAYYCTTTISFVRGDSGGGGWRSRPGVRAGGESVCGGRGDVCGLHPATRGDSGGQRVLHLPEDHSIVPPRAMRWRWPPTGPMRRPSSSAGGQRLARQLERLQRRLGKKVLSANQVTGWHMLRLLGRSERVPRLGCLANVRAPDRYAALAPRPIGEGTGGLP